ncbi:DUF3189 family protein [Desulfotruncus alcoholivorax]|uniref:DUF3189 family protein n=1 Tax=Desulfotruncus alcoholivorax TaxID=265477 RepID=UPI0004018787|nr:DUF3189 family protein [Desulfotruncus alcoholivorax]
MKIIYHCYGGTHSSVTAAAAHLGLLPDDRPPQTEELLAVPFFDTKEKNDHGDITIMGIDQYGNEICFVGQRGKPHLLENIVNSLAEHFAIPGDQFKLVNVMYKVNLSMKVGGTFSRRFRWINSGRPLVAWGTAKAYGQILKLVNFVKARELR